MNFVATGLILSLALAGTGGIAAAQSGPPASETPAAGTSQPTISVTSVSPGTRSDPQTFTGTVVEFELVSPELKTSLTGQSTRLTIDIDCGGERIRARDMVVFTGPRQSGSSRAVNIKNDWESYKGGAYLADVARSVCSSSLSPALLKGTAAGHLPRSPEPGAAAPTGMAGAMRVQFVSSPSQAEVKTQIERIRTRFTTEIDNRQFSIEPARVKGVTRYRGHLGPFATREEAQSFCSRLAELSLPCLVLPASSGK